MLDIPARRILWVKRRESPALDKSVLLFRADVHDPTAIIETISLGSLESVTIPAGAIDEAGALTPLLSVGYEGLPPDGRVYLLRDS